MLTWRRAVGLLQRTDGPFECRPLAQGEQTALWGGLGQLQLVLDELVGRGRPRRHAGRIVLC